MKNIAELRALWEDFARHKEGRWIMAWDNAQRLYHLVYERDLKKILDLGTGIGLSASVMALAMKHKGQKEYSIISIEQSKKCIALAKQLIPKELQEHLSIFEERPTTWSTADIPHIHFSIYDNEGYVEDYDLIVNDGPGPFMEGDNLVDLPNGTIIRCINEIKPGALIAFDGRIESVKHLDRCYGHNFYFQPSLSGGDFNVIEKKEGPGTFRNDSYEQMKQLGYFDE